MSMSDRTYVRYVRVVPGPYHPEIIVVCDIDGPYVDSLIRGIQCFTPDRIPFVMKPMTLKENYAVKPS